MALAAAAAVMAPASAAWAATPLPPGAVAQLGFLRANGMASYVGTGWASPDAADYYTDAAGNLVVVRSDGDRSTLDTYDLTTMQAVGVTRSVSYAYSCAYGGFYAGPDGCFYLLLGAENPTVDDARDVIFVRRYDHDWNLLGEARVQGGATQGVKGVLAPFTFSAAHMELVGDRLVVHMGREMLDPGYPITNLRPQANLTFEVDVDTMTATTFQDLGGYAGCAPSFQQLVAMNGSNLVFIDHGATDPRGIQMGVMADYPAKRSVSTYNLFEFNGSPGDYFTGATVNGLVSGPQGIVVLGTSIPQPNAPNGPLGTATARHNVFAIWADPATGAHTVRWLTSFPQTGADNALEPRVTQVGADRFAVLFSVEASGACRMEYRLIDSAGTVLASASFPRVIFCAGSDPILIGGTLYWTGTHPAYAVFPGHIWNNYLFALDVSSPAAPALRSAGSDLTAPSTASDCVAYYAKAATVRFSAVDEAGGSGVARTCYTLDGGSQVESSSVTVKALGTHTLRFWSIDGVGNVEAVKSVTFTIVTPPPTNGTPSTPSASSARVVRGRSYAYSGYVTRHTAGTLPVTLQFDRYVSGRWVLAKSVAGRASSVLTFSKYSASTSLPYSGKWRVRARHSVGGRYLYGGPLYFTVS